MTPRNDGRRADALRPLTIEPDYLENPHGSALITQGRTKVLCTAMVQEEVPRWLRNKGRGWMTADKKPVKNDDLWKRLDAARERHDVEWKWVKGHADDVMNNRADELARNAIET